MFKNLEKLKNNKVIKILEYKEKIKKLTMEKKNNSILFNSVILYKKEDFNILKLTYNKNLYIPLIIKIKPVFFIEDICRNLLLLNFKINNKSLNFFTKIIFFEYFYLNKNYLNFFTKKNIGIVATKTYFKKGKNMYYKFFFFGKTFIIDKKKINYTSSFFRENYKFNIKTKKQKKKYYKIEKMFKKKHYYQIKKSKIFLKKEKPFILFDIIAFEKNFLSKIKNKIKLLKQRKYKVKKTKKKYFLRKKIKQNATI